MKRTILALAAMVVLIGGAAHADEGMWMIHRLDQAPFAAWKAAGLTLEPADLYNPESPSISDAIVQVGGGTGSFVSSQGLIVTNHHVAFGALQRQSTVEVNVMKDGFLARSKAEEIPAPGYNAYVLKDVKNVTKEVLATVTPDMSDLERYKAIDKAGKILVKQTEDQGDVRADVKEFFGGRDYYLFTYFKIKDVRIVYAPPGAIGVYGGEIDNWMWPRHTGDFSFLRAYVGPNGESAEYSEDNVPYEPRRFLNISKAPLEPGDFTMVMGYPGRTSRNRSTYSIEYVVNTYYPDRIKQYGDLIDILEDIGEKDPAAKIRTASTVRGLANAYKNNQGMLEGLLKHDLLAAKRAEEKDLRAYLADHPEANQRYGKVLDEIKDEYDAYRRYAREEGMLGRMFYINTALGSAHIIAKWAMERDRDDIDRDNGYQDRDEESLRRRLALADKRYAEAADKAIMRYYLETIAAVPVDERVMSIESILEGIPSVRADEGIGQFVDDLYANTKIMSAGTALDMFGKSRSELTALGDPMIDFAMRLVEQEERFENKSDAFDGAMSKLRPELLELRAMVSNIPLYPDANFSMRVSVGSIKGYSPDEHSTYTPFTDLAGVVAKNTGAEPFDCPAKLIELEKTRNFGDYKDPALDDVPVCFLSTDDVTGGNSGSPILNGNGEVIGLVFDGNYEAISADYQFIPDLTRTINVDSRYILFIVDKFAGATELLNELTVVEGIEGAMH